MIENCSCPTGGGVADRAVSREACRSVIRVRRLVVEREVTRTAIFRRPSIHAINVALRAGNRDVGPGQRE